MKVEDNDINPLGATAEITIFVTAIPKEVQIPDNTPPVISMFNIPGESGSLAVSITSFTATDDTGVTGYLLTETGKTPSLNDRNWSVQPPDKYIFSGEGTQTLYAWVKDEAGNISNPASKKVTIILPDYSPKFSEYLFEENSGNIVFDSNGPNNGTISGTFKRKEGASGNGIEFNGSGYINLGDCFSNNIRNEVTLSVWLKPDLNSSGYQGIIMHGGPDTDIYALYIYPETKTIGFKTSGTSSEWITADNIEELWDGNWHHIAVVYDGKEKIIFLDNKLIASTVATGDIGVGTGYNLLLGAGRDETGPELLYSGVMDEVRIYNYALNPGEIGELFHPVNRNLHKINIEENIVICEGGNYMGWATSGIYKRTLERKLQSASGADSIITTYLSVNPAYIISEEASICEGETYIFGTKTIKNAGEYTEVFKSVTGCDSTVILSLSVNPKFHTTEEITIFEGENYSGWSESGVYERNLVSSAGCDSIVTTRLSVLQNEYTEEHIAVCEGDSYNGWTSSGRYERMLKTALGADSVVVTYLEVISVVTNMLEAAICEGETYIFGTKIIKNTGEYTEVFKSVTGCDSTVILSLSVNPKFHTTEEITIFEGENYSGWSESGVYERNLVSSAGCDSIVTTRLSVLQNEYTEEHIAVCEGDSYNGWTSSGRYERMLKTALGADSVVVTYLEVISVVTDMLEVTICEGDTYLFGTKKLKNAGRYSEVFKTVNGCDSIVELNLSVNPKYKITESISINAGENYLGWTQSGIYERKLISSTGCDSIVMINLTVTRQLEEQTIQLKAGWNIISSYLEPSDKKMESVMSQLVSNGTLIKVQGENDKTFEYNAGKDKWINDIGYFEKTQGYKVHVKNNTTLTIRGNKTVLPLNIPLSEGWNIISFPSEKPVDAMIVLQPLISAGILEKTQDEAGMSVENWENIGWNNTIGDFIPGKGYLIKVKAKGVLTVTEYLTKSAQNFEKRSHCDFFCINYEGNGIGHMNINLVNLTDSGLKEGDEIAAFSNGMCFGAIKLTGDDILMNAVNLPATSSEGGLYNGFAENDSIILKFWSSDKTEELSVMLNLLNGNLNYNRRASVFASLSNITVSANEISDKLPFVNVYPNPTEDFINIRFLYPESPNGIISVLDISGRLLKTQKVNSDIEIIQVMNLHPGTYFLKIPLHSGFMIHKFIKK